VAVGILDMFSKEARAARAVARNVKKLTNKWIHMDERRAAIENLRALGTDDAIEGLLLRYGFVIDNTTVDEEEKQRVADALIGFGERSIPALLSYIRRSDTLTWPLKVLCQIEDEGKVVDHLTEILADIDPLDKRAAERRIQIILQLADLQDPRICGLLTPLLTDDNEDVVFHTVEALERLGDPEARVPLLEVALTHESIRLRSRAVAALARRGWSVAERRDEVSKVLPPNYYIDRDGTIRDRLQEILQGLRADDPRLRRFAARDATLLDKPDEAIEGLIEALRDPDASVRAAVASALSKVGDFRAVPGLEEALRDRDQDVRRKAEEALRRLRT
jgi:HEAT repeat protein